MGAARGTPLAAARALTSHLPPRGISPRSSRSIVARIAASLCVLTSSISRPTVTGRHAGGVDVGQDALCPVELGLQPGPGAHVCLLDRQAVQRERAPGGERVPGGGVILLESRPGFGAQFPGLWLVSGVDSVWESPLGCRELPEIQEPRARCLGRVPLAPARKGHSHAHDMPTDHRATGPTAVGRPLTPRERAIRPPTRAPLAGAPLAGAPLAPARERHSRPRDSATRTPTTCPLTAASVGQPRHAPPAAAPKRHSRTHKMPTHRRITGANRGTHPLTPRERAIRPPTRGPLARAPLAAARERDSRTHAIPTDRRISGPTAARTPGSRTKAPLTHPQDAHSPPHHWSKPRHAPADTAREGHSPTHQRATRTGTTRSRA